MPWVKCPVDSLFTQQPPKPGYKLGKRACMFCSTSVSDNGTRMMAHIKLCKEINDDERESYISGDRGNLVFSTFEREEDGMDMDMDVMLHVKYKGIRLNIMK